ncbi:MAG: hypothetical protein IPO50_08465 [Sphingomonadales bacterium]|nr:hypothetical protein [Sphingomonadales bacterium]
MKQNVDAALADFVTKIEDAIADGSTFDDVITSRRTERCDHSGIDR